MTHPNHVVLPGSTRLAPANAEALGLLEPDTTIDFTLILRRKAELPAELVFGADTISSSELADTYGADADDVTLVTSVLGDVGARIVELHPGSRRIRATANAAAVTELFGVQLGSYRSPHPHTGEPATHWSHTGPLLLPTALAGVVVAVVGLDNRPLATPYVLKAVDPAASFTPVQLGALYGFPAADGHGLTAAIIELGGGITTADLDTYFKGLGLTTPSVTAVGVDGGTNTPDPNVDGEVMLDIEVLGAIAPKTNQLVYFAPNTDQGFIDAISTAVHATPTPTVISISWGADEDAWQAQSRTSMDQVFADGAALGVTICVASGDRGSTNGNTDGLQHCEYPASSPYVLAVGGTTLHGDPQGNLLESEVVWNNNNGNSTGGGVSALYPLPSWQAGVGVPPRAGATTTGRGVPDVAADADPYTGYSVRVDGQDMVIGGTSAAAPLWAGLICRYAQLLNVKFGLLQTAIYKGVTAGHNAPGFRPITSGTNGAYSAAAAGYNACTGLGTPDGANLLTALRAHYVQGPAHR